MFWRFGGYANISTLDTILDKPDVTVEELLDESDLIQELKQQNSKLVEFLREEPVLKKLLGYVVADDLPVTSEEKQDDGKTEEEKSVGISFFGKGKSRSRSKSVHQHNGDGETEQDKKEAQRKKYAYVACEVLSAEVWSITEAMLENREHLEEFWGYMRRPAQLDPLQAGYFTKVNEALLDKKTEEMMAFFKSLDGIVPAMLQHVDCPMVMDLLLKIISLEKHEGGAGIVDWLQSQDLIPLLLANLSPEHSSATQTSAGDFLKAIITISANATTQDQSVIGPNELTRQLVSEKCINMLISDMLRGGNPLTVGVGIIIEVIRKNNSDYDLDNQVGPEPKTSDPIYLGTLLRAFAQHVPDFMHLVRSPSAKKADLKVAFGSKIEPLGFDRFKTCELMAELLHCSNMGLLNERGAEEEVRKRDAERERLKADGRLATPKGPVSPNQESSHDEFASSVDSHGFHHAERPNDDDISNEPEEIKKLEVQNASDEDGFEKVNAPSDDLPDEVTFDDLDEKLEQTGLPALEKVDKREPTISPQSPEIPAPLSPRKQNLQPKQGHLFDPPPTEAADSPTTSVTDQISKLDVDEDTVMTEFGEEPSATRKQNSWSLIQQFEEQPLSMPTDDDDTTAELDRDLAHRPEDKPAPLFAKKESLGQSTTTVGDDRQHIDQSVATIQAGDEGADDSERSPYESESNGRPVVGDALKMQFVEHQVVPTILDFFFRFPWNNFLHNVVYDVVQQVFNGTLDRGYNRALAFALFTPAIAAGQSGAELGLVSSKDITDRILDGQLASEKSQAAKGMRLGYMGHLTLIAEEVCKFGNRHPPEHLDQTILDRVSREEWVQYVEGTLAETRDKDNAVLGGVRPENAIQRPMAGLGGGFSSNAANALASAGMTPQDSLAMSEGTVGQSFEINSGSMLSGFGDGGDDDEDMLEVTGERRLSATDAFSEDEQTLTADPATTHDGASTTPSIPPPLNIPPSRARLQLAARLAAKKKEEEEEEEEEVDASGLPDPDAADAAAVELAQHVPTEPNDIDPDRELSAATGLQITGLRGSLRGSAAAASGSRFTGLFSSSDSSSSGGGSDDDDDDERNRFNEDKAGRDETSSRPGDDYETTASPIASSSRGAYGSRRHGVGPRRPSTTEAKTRRSLIDDDEDEDDDGGLGSVMDKKLILNEAGESPFADQEERSAAGHGVIGDDEESSGDSSDEGLVEIRARRISR